MDQMFREFWLRIIERYLFFKTPVRKAHTSKEVKEVTMTMWKTKLVFIYARDLIPFNIDLFSTLF